MRHAFAKSLLLLVITALATAAIVVLPTVTDRGPATELSIGAVPSTVIATAPTAAFEPTATPTPVQTTAPVGVPVHATAPDLEIPDLEPPPVDAENEGGVTALGGEPGDGDTALGGEVGIADTDTPAAVDSVSEADPSATATAKPTATAEPTAAPTATAEPTPTLAATATPTPQPTATPLPTATPVPPPTATPVPQPTATPPPPPTATPVPQLATTQVESAWLYVDSIDGLLLRAEPGGSVLRALAHRAEVFATGTIIEYEGREWMQVESPARGWAARDYLTSIQPEAPAVVTPESSGEPPSAADWAALRQCESGGSYTIVSANGLYHGAYQFLPSTWDTVAGRAGRPDLIGVLPSQASPADQDALAQFLYSLQGASPWPHCGQALL